MERAAFFPDYSTIFKNAIPGSSPVVNVTTADTAASIGQPGPKTRCYVTKVSVRNRTTGRCSVTLGTNLNSTWAQILNGFDALPGFTSHYNIEDMPLGDNTVFADADIYARVNYPDGTPGSPSVDIQLEWAEIPGTLG